MADQRQRSVRCDAQAREQRGANEQRAPVRHSSSRNQNKQYRQRREPDGGEYKIQQSKMAIGLR